MAFGIAPFQLTTNTSAAQLTSTQRGMYPFVTVINDDGAATNGNTTVVYLGDSTVSSTNGICLRPDASFTFRDIDPSTIWAKAASGTPKLTILCETTKAGIVG